MYTVVQILPEMPSQVTQIVTVVLKVEQIRLTCYLSP